ncbi:MAG: AsmA-like C-terminal region-containing protein [Acetobacteraceae bacterium]
MLRTLAMLKRSGQAARLALHVLIEVVLGLALILLLAAGVLAWRLSTGPIDLAFLLPRLSSALAGPPGGPHVSVGAASLAWEGFHNGLESPLDFVLADTVMTSPDDSGHVVIPRAELALSLPALLLGRIVPRSVVIEGPRLHLVRSESGGFAFSFGARRTHAAPSVGTARLAGEVLAALATPPGDDQSLPARRFPALSQLRSLVIRDAEITVVDHELGLTWFAPTADIRLTRPKSGGLDGAAQMALQLKGHRARLAATATLDRRQRLEVAAHLSAVTPSDLAALSPSLAPLAAVNTPVSLALDLRFGPRFGLENARLEADAGPGTLLFGGASIPLKGATLLIASVGEDALRVDRAELSLVGPGGQPGPVVRASGEAVRNADGVWNGDFAVAVKSVPMADLGRYWPPEIAPGGQKWVSKRITGGIADHASAAFRFAYTPRDDAFNLEGAYGTVSASGLVVHWLPPAPPLTDGEATLSVVSPDVLSIAVHRAAEGRLKVLGGTVTISGLEEHDQNANITTHITDPLDDILALLARPELNLLSRHPLPVHPVGGNVDARVTIALPLLANEPIDQIAIDAKADLREVSLANVAPGLDLKGGAFSLTAGNAGMELSGSGVLAGIRTRLSYTMDFNAGPPAAVNQKLDASATTTAAFLAHAGLFDPGDMIDGPIALSGALSIARNGATSARLEAGLAEARLRMTPLGFVKPPGVPASVSASLKISGDRIDAINAFDLTGPGIAVQGSASFAGGRPQLVRITHAVLGRTDLSGSVRFPGQGAPIAIVLEGPLIDLSGRFNRPAPGNSASTPQPRKSPAEPGLPWSLDVRFGRAMLAHGRSLTGGVLHAQSNGRLITGADLSASLSRGELVSLTLAAKGGTRVLSITSANAGDLLAALGVTDRIEGGQLSLAADYDDTAAAQPLAGTAKISDFRVKNAPGLAKVLQAMTLYGLADAMSGPGLDFSELVAPFQLENDKLSLQGARAFSSSLGLTAEGTIDLAADTAKISGTIVPAYFFNSLLGRIPLFGRLFSPEKGGGLFAATYSIEGPLNNPRVGVNPLAALTPGFLRDLFHIFD